MTAILRERTTYPAPGSPDSPITVAARYGNFIGGVFVAPVDGRYRENRTPVTGELICEVADSTPGDIELALDAAHAAKDAWAARSPAERASVLNAIADVMEANLEELAIVESWDNGKPVRETLGADVPLAIDHFRYFAGAVRAEEGRISEIDSQTYAYHLQEPLGVVGQIIPFNFPLLMAAWKIAPALAAGNCTVVKPASPTPWSVLKLCELIADVVPAGVVNVVNGPGGEIGKALATNPRIAKVSFTGSTEIGKQIMRVRRRVADPVDDRAGRQVAQHLLRRCDGRRRRVPRQGGRRPRDVRVQQGRGLHLPVTRAHPGGHL